MKGKKTLRTKIVQKIISIAEGKGWSVSTNRIRKGLIQFEFFQYTPAGMDFCFSVEMVNNVPETLVENIKEYYEEFDVDEEAYLWIGHDGHGKNGAPYHITNIVRDMEVAEEMVYELYSALNENF